MERLHFHCLAATKQFMYMAWSVVRCQWLSPSMRMCVADCLWYIMFFLTLLAFNNSMTEFGNGALFNYTLVCGRMDIAIVDFYWVAYKQYHPHNKDENRPTSPTIQEPIGSRVLALTLTWQRSSMGLSQLPHCPQHQRQEVRAMLHNYTYTGCIDCFNPVCFSWL